MAWGKKQYGQSRTDECPFCHKQSTTTNSQGFPVCKDHKDAIMNDMKCACGEYLDIKKGKYGVFFLCMNCGPMSPSKVYAINDVKDISKKTPEVKKEKKLDNIFENKKNKFRQTQKETTIRSDDPLYFS